METLILNLSAKKLDAEVHYGKTHRYAFRSESKILPLEEAVQKEVKQKLSRKQRRALSKVLPIIVAASVYFLITGNISLAAAPASALPQTIMPGDIQKIGAYLLGITTITGTMLAMILAQLAGGYKMMRKSREASEWLTDILKGYATVIAAPVLIMTIAFLGWLLFRSLPWFISPF